MSRIADFRARAFLGSRIVALAALMGLVTGCGGGGSSAATVESLEVFATNVQGAVGTTTQLTATALYSNGTHQDVTTQASWSSSNTAVVATSITTPGLVTSLSSGTATISATFQKVSGSLQFATTPATLVSLQVTPPAPTIANGLSVQLTAMGVFSDNTTQNLTSQVTWSAAAAAVATVSNAAGFVGLVSAADVGTTAITASSGSITASATVTVTAATLTSIQVTPGNLVLAVGTTQALTATGRFSDGSQQDITSKAVWSSSNLAVATLGAAAGSNGLLTAAGTGTSTITAAYLGSVSGGVTVSVTPATLVSIQVTPGSFSLPLGGAQNVTAIGTYSDKSTQDLTSAVTWSSGTPSVATVSNATGSNGLVSTVAPGATNIIATLSGVTSPGVALAVTTAALISVSVTPAPTTLAMGTTQQYVATGTYSDRSTQNLTSIVTWVSDTPSVAAISNAAGSNGLATAVGVGHANLSASLGTVTSPANLLTVTAAALVSIQIQAPSPSLSLGTTETLTATGTFSDQSTQDLSTQVSWSSSNPQAATVSASGLVGTLAVGGTQISASLAGVTSPPVALNVTNATLTAITIGSSPLTLLTSQTQPLIATGIYSDNSTQNLTSAVTWSSDTPGVATISSTAGTNGWVSAVSSGTATITASLQGTASAGVTLTVVDYMVLGAAAGLNGPAGVAVDSSGNVYVADTGNMRVCEINAQDGCTVLGALAGFNYITGVAVDGSGNVYVADPANNRICEISALGGCTVVGSSAGFMGPLGVAVDRLGNVYVADTENNRACEITALAGCASLGSSYVFSNPTGIAVSLGGGVYVANRFSGLICQINTQGGCSVLTAANVFNTLFAVAADGNGNVYATDIGDNKLCEINAQGGCTVLGATFGLIGPAGIAIDSSGNIYVADQINSRIVKFRLP
jgi:hypothetical protein